MAARILIVEDEPALLRGLKDTFVSKGCDVSTARRMARPVWIWRSKGSPDLILLDIMLPQRERLRESAGRCGSSGLDMPILMLTAKGQEEDIVLGLNLGADDYVTKPFKHPGTGRATRTHFSAGSGTQAGGNSRFGDSRLNLARAQAVPRWRGSKAHGQGIPPAGRTSPRGLGALWRANDILNAVWGNSVMVTPRSIDRCVTTLRAKIEHDPHNPTYIHTIRDIGYRFEPGSD